MNIQTPTEIEVLHDIAAALTKNWIDFGTEITQYL